MTKIPDDIRKQIFNDAVRKKMSERKKEYFANMTPEQRQERAAKIRTGCVNRAISLSLELAALKKEFEAYKAAHPED